MLRIIRLPEQKKGKELFQDANDILSSFPFAKQEQREPTEQERRKKNFKKVPKLKWNDLLFIWSSWQDYQFTFYLLFEMGNQGFQDKNEIKKARFFKSLKKMGADNELANILTALILTSEQQNYLDIQNDLAEIKANLLKTKFILVKIEAWQIFLIWVVGICFLLTTSIGLPFGEYIFT